MGLGNREGPMVSHLTEAAKWAEKARAALVRRDEEVRLAVADGEPKLRVAKAVGLSAPAIDRILARDGAPNGRW